MTTVAHLLDMKGHEIWWISPDATVYEAVRLMADKGVGALVVVEDARLVGVISERDYAREIALKDRSSKATLVRDVMTRRVLYVRPEQRLEECMALMTERQLRHLPVIDDNERLIGVISIRDVVKYLISEKEFLIEQLENYITDRRVLA